jgi:hypothetical protein
MRHTRPGVKGWLTRQFIGWELRKSVGDFVRKHRLIDRVSKRYVEKIATEDGTVLRDVDEPLPQHTGHGTAKFKKQS